MVQVQRLIEMSTDNSPSLHAASSGGTGRIPASTRAIDLEVHDLQRGSHQVVLKLLNC